VPTVLICSDEFGPLGRAEAEVLGMAGLPLVPVPHPLAGNKAELVAAKARGIVDDIVELLTGDADVVAERQRTTFTRLTQRRLERGAVCIDDVCAIDVATLERAP
jgi:hypothetical protein